MDALQTLGPLMGVLVGGALTGFTSFLKARKERKQIAASALSDLLEIRHRIVGVDLILRELRSRAVLQNEFLPHLRNFIDSTYPMTAELDKRYDNAITLLSAVSPLLAFELRSKNSLPRTLATVRSLATQSGADLAQFEKFESQLREAATPTLNKAILRLALSHSLISWLRVRSFLAHSASLPTEVSAFFNTALAGVPHAPSPSSTEA